MTGAASYAARPLQSFSQGDLLWELLDDVISMAREVSSGGVQPAQHATGLAAIMSI